MDQQLVSAWLQLSHGDWPPDHYTLLGLEPGEPDVARIEQRVYQRMEILRCYQLTHPEEATEAMNRLAQALVCLTDAGAKRTYDAVLFASRGLTEKDWRSSPPTAFPDWQTSMPPVRVAASNPDGAPEEPAQFGEGAPTADALTSPGEADRSAVPSAPPSEPRAVSSAGAASGRLRNRRALYARITRLRRLHWAWKQAGEFLKQEPARVVNRPTDAVELMANMHAIRALLSGAPPILGNAGEAGYHVLTLARQEDIVPRLKKLTPPQRESLARDWQAGYDSLHERLRIVRKELHELRSRSAIGRGLHLLAAALTENIGLVFLVLAVVAINLAFQDKFPELRELRFRQACAVIIIIAGRLITWWLSYRPAKMRYRVTPRIMQRKSMIAKDLRRQTESSGAKA